MQPALSDREKRHLLHQLHGLERNAQRKNQALYLAQEFGILRVAIERIAERGSPSDVARMYETLRDLQSTIAELPWKYPREDSRENSQEDSRDLGRDRPAR